MIQSWLTQHWFVFILTLKRLISAPITSLLSIIVIGIAFSLPTGIYTLMENLRTLSGQTAGSAQISLFFKLEADQKDIDKIQKLLEENPQIQHIQFVSRHTALQQLQQGSGMTDPIINLDRNPLPDAFIVHVQNGVETVNQLHKTMQEWPEIEHVQYDSAWIERLDALLRFGRFTVLLLATLLSIAIVAVMFNTIRLQILTKRDEIEISKLIGATDSFIRRPFLYFGAMQGLLGGLTAWLIITLAIQRISEELTELARLYSLNLNLQPLSPEDSISLLLFSTWLGWLGARISVASHLWQIEPK